MKKIPAGLPEPEVYTFEHLAKLWNTTEQHVSELVWGKQTLRVAIPVKNLKLGEYIKASPSYGVAYIVSHVECRLIYRKSQKDYSEEFVYIRHPSERTSKGKSENKKIKILIASDGFSSKHMRSVKFMDDSDDIFCDKSGEPIKFDCRAVPGSIGKKSALNIPFDEMVPASCKLYRGNGYIITQEEKARFDTLMQKESEIAARLDIPEKNLKKAVAILALWVANDKANSKFRSGTGHCGIGTQFHFPNMERINEVVNEFAENSKINTKGFRSLNKTIAEGLELLDIERI